MNADALPNYAEWYSPDALGVKVGATAVMVTNWILNGIRTDKGRVRLAAVKVGGRWRIDPAKVAEFIAATTAASLPAEARNAQPVKEPVRVSEAERVRRVNDAMARMKEMGIGAPRQKRGRSMTAPNPTE